jgi:hypothetical protein
MALQTVSKLEVEVMEGEAPSVSEYVARFEKARGKGVESILEMGAILVDFKKDHEREFIAALEPKFRISRQTAFRLMKVYDHALISNVAHGQHLPPSWRTLYELTKLPLPLVEEALEDGRIHPGLERKDVLALIPKNGHPAAECETCEVQDLENSIAAGRARFRTCRRALAHASRFFFGGRSATRFFVAGRNEILSWSGGSWGSETNQPCTSPLAASSQTNL